MRLALCFALLAAVCLLPAQEEEDKEKDITNPLEGRPEMVEAGRKLYLTSCSGCHGPNAEGGRGPRLIKSGMVRGSSNRRIFTTIKEGVRGSDMPPTPLDDGKIWQLVSYVKSINAPAYDSKPPGDPARGEKLFHGKAGCIQCHAIRGNGGVLGPDLSQAGLTRSYAQLRESLLNPSERPTEGFQAVTVTLKSGGKVEGIAKNYTNYSIQVIDATGRLHLLNKLDLSEIVFRKSSLMPEDYARRLTKSEIDDVLAFVSRQAVRLPQPEEKEPKK
jgi:cytochrome c oxidase cbb3-type subunit 3